MEWRQAGGEGMAALPGHMQATNDVISVGICSVVAAAICTAACEGGERIGQ